MNKLTLTSLAILAGCTGNYRSMTMEVTRAPASVAGVTSALAAPSRCPIYTPTGKDIDTPELPYSRPILFGCGVDSDREAYGLVTGDVGDLAVLAGAREIGVFYAFDSSLQANPPTVASLDLDGDTPAVRAWAAPRNVHDAHHCCPEFPGPSEPDDSVPITVVAIGASGMLLSLGHFDQSATQVAIELDGLLSLDGDGPEAFFQRFYVNAEPPLGSP